MSDTNITIEHAIANYINEMAIAKATGKPAELKSLEQVFPGEANAEFRASIKKDGLAEYAVKNSGERQLVAVDVDELGNVMATAAAIPRTPSAATVFLQQISEFRTVSSSGQNRTTEIPLFRNIATFEGTVNNAINKLTALVATEGQFQVRRIKGVKGKGEDKRADEFLVLLKYWVENVNSPGPEGVVTGGRGIKAFISQGVRQALIEGDHFARTNWQKVSVPTLKNAKFNLPINLQTFAGEFIDIPEQAQLLGIEWIDWVPGSQLINAVENPKDPAMKPEFQKLIPKDVMAELKKRNGRYRLQPGLMAHIKHRGTMSQAYGESFIKPAMGSIAYKRSLLALDIVTIENLMNRILVLKVGSDDPQSVYHKQEVSARRVKLLENMIRKVGPHAMLIWAGPDLEIVEAGAHGKILEMDGRYKMADTFIRQDLGTPSALLTGEGADGKASAMAAIIGVAAQIQELQDQYGQTLRTWAQRIGQENGYDDVDVTWKFAPNPLISKQEMLNSMIQAYQEGLLPNQIVLEGGFNLDYDAIVAMMEAEVAAGYRDEAFGAPKALVQKGINSNPAGTGNGGGGAGRPTNTQNPGQTDPRTSKPKNNTTEQS